MQKETSIGGYNERFPVTRLSAIIASHSDNAIERTRAFDTLIAAYWKPTYKYIRLKWHKSNEDAKDLTQGFFAQAMEKGFFDRYNPSKARFRTFLRTCIDGYVANENKAASRLKRGGDVFHIPLDFEVAEQELISYGKNAFESLESYFDKEWVRSFFKLVIDELSASLEEQGKTTHLKLFEQYDLAETTHDTLSYEQLAQQFGLPITDVTNYLALARREFRRIALEQLRGLTVTEQEFQEEARSLLGITL